jgi:ketosteroid isomerase-like protein
MGSRVKTLVAKFLSWLMLASLATACASTRATHEGLDAAAHAYETAQIAGDAAALARLVADDYVLVGSDGAVQNKAELIAFWTAPGFDPEPVAVQDPVERKWRNGAALGGLVTLRGKDQGAAFSVRIRYIDVWEFRDGRWQVVYGQTTRAASP